VSKWLADTRIRFLIAGGSAALLNWLIRFPLSEILPYVPAVMAAMAIGMLYGFLIYRNWAFRSDRSRSLWQEIRDFLIVNAAGMVATLAVSVAVLKLLSSLDMSSFASEALAHAGGIATGAVVNFLGHRHITFRPAGQ
jgi:putative flippase GtrA